MEDDAEGEDVDRGGGGDRVFWALDPVQPRAGVVALLSALPRCLLQLLQIICDVQRTEILCELLSPVQVRTAAFDLVLVVQLSVQLADD